jgi:transcriptional regulator with XRE-family HTH domain
MTGKELRFLRTEMGMTQAELAKIVHREPLTISRWERSEDEIDSNAEVLVRVCN